MFKNLPTAIVVLLLMTLPFTVAAQQKQIGQFNMNVPSGQLTLRQAQTMALESSPDIFQALDRIDAVKAVVDQARANLRPTLSLKVGQSWYNSTSNLDWDPETRIEDSFRLFNAGIEASWLLFDGFSSRARILAAKHQAKASEQDLIEAQRLLSEAVSTSFYQAQLAMESMLIASQDQQYNRTLEEDSEKRWRAGTIPESDMLNFSVKAIQAESDYLEAEQSFQLVTTILAELLALDGSELPSDLYPRRSTEDVRSRQIPDYDTEFAYAMEKRPDLKSLEFAIESLKQTRRERKGSYWPKLLLNGGLDYNKYDDLGSTDQEEHDLYTGLQLSWDLYQGGKRSAQIRETDSDISATRQQYRQQVLGIQSDIHQAIASARSTKATYERQYQALLLTERIREHVDKSYRAGVANLTRLNEAQTDLVRAAGSEATSRINYLLALQQLKAASGRILER